MNTQIPETLVDAIRHFADPDICFDYAVKLRWPNGVSCPTCGSTELSFIKTRKIWKCKNDHPKKQFSIKVGTIFEDSALPIDKWLITIWMIANAKNGVSSHEIHRAIGVTQKSAWFMLHRIRLAMQTGTFEKLSGEVEADETFIGGKISNMHKNARKVRGRGAIGKAVVMGLLARHGHAVTFVVPNTQKKTLQPEVKKRVKPGSRLYTDTLASYFGLDAQYLHEMIDHAEAYVRGHVHTNSLENYWCLLKRSLRGTYVCVDPIHLSRYLDEQAFRFNNRHDSDSARFIQVASAVVGKRLAYDELTGKCMRDHLRGR